MPFCNIVAASFLIKNPKYHDAKTFSWPIPSFFRLLCFHPFQVRLCLWPCLDFHARWCSFPLVLLGIKIVTTLAACRKHLSGGVRTGRDQSYLNTSWTVHWYGTTTAELSYYGLVDKVGKRVPGQVADDLGQLSWSMARTKLRLYWVVLGT